MGLGFHFPFSTIGLDEHRELTRSLLELGYEHVWTGENPGTNGFMPLTLASQWAPGIGLGSACFPVQTRGPGLFADTAAQLCELAPPGKVVIGIGSSSEFVVSRTNGRPYGSPLTAVRDMARFLRQAFSGESVKMDCESFRVRYKLTRKLPAPPRVMVAALRPKMIELAAQDLRSLLGANRRETRAAAEQQAAIVRRRAREADHALGVDHRAQAR